MYKLTFILSFILLSCAGNVQTETNVKLQEETEKKPDCLENLPEDFFILDTMSTAKGSMIYWQYNQDSSWLTYEDINGVKTMLNTMYCPMMHYSYQLGMQRYDVYPKYAVFYEELISGCCTPPNVVFLDNSTAKELRRIDSYSFIRLDEDYCIFFKDTALNTASFLDLKTDKTTTLIFPEGLFMSKMESSRNTYPREFFNEIDVNKNNLKVVYQYKNKQSDPDWIKDSIIVNMKK